MTEDTHEEDKPTWNEGFQPPPWSAEPDEDFGPVEGLPDLEAYCVVSYGYNDEMPIVCAGTKNWPLWREQALILAAALELMAALRPLADLPIGGEIEDDRDLVIYRNADKAITVGDVLAARAAIAKAEGKGQ